ncbi:hypothetical protein BRADI_3g37145v3 [Brachypodium distachyon]|uniref:Uncharacterized protein n=1 Tax=Brachypodium distachyon TaxID=15368 RepID=A0A0Q3Q9X3_BRADI|nr:hypothetical protein BRADI_3g37145v3 [Brachypodium distachyon]
MGLGTVHRRRVISLCRGYRWAQPQRNILSCSCTEENALLDASWTLWLVGSDGKKSVSFRGISSDVNLGHMRPSCPDSIWARGGLDIQSLTCQDRSQLGKPCSRVRPRLLSRPDGRASHGRVHQSKSTH